MLSQKICFLSIIIILTTLTQNQAPPPSQPTNAQTPQPVTSQPKINQSVATPPPSPEGQTNTTKNQGTKQQASGQPISNTTKTPQTAQSTPPTAPQPPTPTPTPTTQTLPQPPQSQPTPQQPHQQLPQELNNKQSQQIKYTQLTKYQQTINRQRDQSRTIQSTQDYTIPKKTVLFQVHKSIQQFRINPTINHQVIISMIVYILENNVYGFIKDLQSASPLKVFVYEDNNRIVSFGEFYFEKTLKFNVKSNSNYTLKFYNDQVNKLVSFTYPNLIQSVHIQTLYKKDKGEYHLHKLTTLTTKINEITQRLRRNSLLDRINNQTMMTFMKSYSGYQFVEMLVVLTVCAFQVHLVKKMFKNDSIL